MTQTPTPLPPPVPPDLLFLHPCSASPAPVSAGNRSDFLHPELLPMLPIAQSSLIDSNVTVHPKPNVAPELWVSKFKSSFQNLSKLASPTFSEDGTPTVKAPDSITLGSSRIWKDHLVAFFHGNPPSPSKVFSDLNPIWGKQGRISVKHHSKGVFLIYIPCEVTRKWVLDVGFWHSGNCSFTVTLWTPTINLAPMKLVHAPIWVVFRNIPPELWSIEGFSTIASGVGIPVHSEFSNLKPYSNGVVRLKVVVELAKKRPASVRVTDKFGFSVLVSANYPKLPPFCSFCGEFGHLGLRCPGTVVHSYGLVPQARSSPVPNISVSPRSPPASVVKSSTPAAQPTPISPAALVPANKSPGLIRSKSLPSSPSTASDNSCSGVWVPVVRRSKPPKPSKTVSASQPSVHHVTSSQFGAEEDIIKEAQQILRNRLAMTDSAAFSSGGVRSAKSIRKKQRNLLYLLSSSSSGSEGSVGSPSQPSVSGHAPVTRGQSGSRFVPLLKA